MAHLDGSGSSICSWDGSIHSWDEAVELWPTANIKISSSGGYFPTWPLEDYRLWHLEDFTSTHGVCCHGGQALLVYDGLIRAIVAYNQQLYADS
jgi:hypothetical protein